MAETRGYETINDRSAGWGTGVDGDAQPDADAVKEATSARLGRALKARKVAKAGNNVEIADRSTGKGGSFDPTNGADAGYLDAETPTAIGTSRELDEATGSNTAYQTTDSEATVAGRTADSRNTVQLDDGNATKRAEARRTSIVDRTDGWGHTAGTFNARKDS